MDYSVIIIIIIANTLIGAIVFSMIDSSVEGDLYTWYDNVPGGVISKPVRKFFFLNFWFLLLAFWVYLFITTK